MTGIYSKIFVFTCTLLLFLSFKGNLVQAQTTTQSLAQTQMLKTKPTDEKTHIHQHDIRFMRTRSSSVLVRYNPISLLFGGMMYFYQGVISPQLPSECLFVESCSEFSKTLILEYGLFKGVLTTSDRLMRCNRISALDVHPLMIDPQSGRVTEPVEIYRFTP